ncbi:hypothetical protein KW516_19305 [Vibrio fluvialis]|nr:hypothetical protein [Vibrio fluvialis]
MKLARTAQTVAMAENGYYVSEIKHEITQAYYDHYGSLLKSEEHTLALEIYLRSYNHRQIASFKNSDIGVFAARTIQFDYVTDDARIKTVRLNLADPVLIPDNHFVITLERDDELLVQYHDLMRRVENQSKSEELTMLLSRIDALSARVSLSVFKQKLMLEGGYVAKAIRDMNLRLIGQDIKVKK